MTEHVTRSTRERILAAATELLVRGGEDAASTRAVSAAAGVQAPTIYRLFGDKQGLLDAVAIDVFETYLARISRRRVDPDPVAALRTGFDEHVAFGLEQPEVYGLLVRRRPAGDPPPAMLAAAAVLEGHIHRIALAGRLRVAEPLAFGLVQAAATGVISTLLAIPAPGRDPQLVAIAREAVIAAITVVATAAVEPGCAGAAIALLAGLEDAAALTPAERALMGEWLTRLTETGQEAT